MTKKKILSLILACMFVIIAAAGCGKKNNTGDEATQAGETSVESTEAGNSQNTESLINRPVKISMARYSSVSRGHSIPSANQWKT